VEKLGDGRFLQAQLERTAAGQRRDKTGDPIQDMKAILRNEDLLADESDFETIVAPSRLSSCRRCNRLPIERHLHGVLSGAIGVECLEKYVARNLKLLRRLFPTVVQEAVSKKDHGRCKDRGRLLSDAMAEPDGSGLRELITNVNAAIRCFSSKERWRLSHFPAGTGLCCGPDATGGDRPGMPAQAATNRT
jgi:hypothetical protein